MLRIALVFALVLAACKQEKKQDPPAPTPASGTAAVAPPTPIDAAPAKTELLPHKLGDKEGIVFAEKQGEPVTAAGATIADGTKVEVIGDNEVGVGAAEDAKLKVKHEGKEVELPADRVLVETALQRSPDGEHAVFTAITGCGDVCHAVVYLVGADGRRTKLGEGGPDTLVAWSADHVAIGNGSLWVVSLADHGVKPFEDYTSPAYSPDGVLYVRNADGAAFKLDGDKLTQVWKPKKPRKQPESDEEPYEDPPPVKFEGGKPKFEL